MTRQFAFDNPDDAITAVCARLTPVGGESVPLAAAAGRVLADAVAADRDSPACDVSAMDGYAVRLARLGPAALPVRGEARIGAAVSAMPGDGAIRIVTGAPVPAGADAVIRREDVDESDPGTLRLRVDAGAIKPGQHIRKRGENIAAGAPALQANTRITPAVLAMLANFGVADVPVRRRVRVGILSTGDELVDVSARPAPWEIRDSNGPALAALLGAGAWLDVAPPRRGADVPQALAAQVMELRDRCDVVLLSGGVSMGDRDFVPQIVAQAGGRTVFHKLPVRPGKPILAAVTDDGRLLVGLPGNPVSALVGAVRLVGPMLRQLGGIADGRRDLSPVRLTNADEATIKLWWWRLARFAAPGSAALVATRGSGDLVSAARADGFIEVPPGAGGAGPWQAYRWEI